MSDDAGRSARFHIGIDALDLSHESFASDEWVIAMAIGLGINPDDERPPLDELADAMLAWAEGPEIDELTATAVDAVWSNELETEIRDGFERAAALGDDWRPAVEAAAAEFECDPRRSPVTRAVVQQLATELGSLDLPVPFFCLCCIEEVLRIAPPEHHRELALEVATLACRDASVPSPEIALAIAAHAPLRIATDERRQAVRDRLARLGRLGRSSLPALAAQLEQIAAEPLPADPAADDAWGVVARTLLANVAGPELN